VDIRTHQDAQGLADAGNRPSSSSKTFSAVPQIANVDVLGPTESKVRQPVSRGATPSGTWPVGSSCPFSGWLHAPITCHRDANTAAACLGCVLSCSCKWWRASALTADAAVRCCFTSWSAFALLRGLRRQISPSRHHAANREIEPSMHCCRYYKSCT
jgi:hypothetical protein